MQTNPIMMKIRQFINQTYQGLLRDGFNHRLTEKDLRLAFSILEQQINEVIQGLPIIKKEENQK